MIILTINGQEMSGTLTAPLVSGQVNFVDVKTFFDSSWDGLNKSYQFKNGDRVVELESNNEIIQLPYEATLDAGCIEINVFGTLLDVDGVTVLRKATANYLRFKVNASNASDDPDNVGDVSATVVEQIRKIAEDTDVRVDELIEDLENGVYNTGGSSGDEDGGGITKEIDPTVPKWAKQPSKPTYTKTEVGLSNVDNVRQYSSSNPPPYPVTSVNGKTGAVEIEIPSVPTKTSQLTNDSGFITLNDIPDIPVDVDVPTKVSELENDAGYITSKDIPAIPTKTSELTNDSEFASETFVKNEIANAQLGGEGGNIDLSGYATKDDLNNKVDKVTGKSLIDDTEIARLKSLTNYDDTKIKEELDNIDQDISNINQNLTELSQELGKKANTSDIPTVPTKTSDLDNDSGYITEYTETDPIYSADKPNLALKSEIPTNLSDLNNDTGYITDYTETDPTIPSHVKAISETDIDNWNNKAGKSEIPDITTKQDTLVSGTNIKTINGESILGSGNITIAVGSDITIDTEMSDTSENAVQNKVIKAYVDGLVGNIESLLAEV